MFMKTYWNSDRSIKLIDQTGRNDIFVTLNLSIHEHRLSFCFFKSPLISIMSMSFSAYRLYTYFVTFIPKYFTFLEQFYKQDFFSAVIMFLSHHCILCVLGGGGR